MGGDLFIGLNWASWGSHLSIPSSWAVIVNFSHGQVMLRIKYFFAYIPDSVNVASFVPSNTLPLSLVVE